MAKKQEEKEIKTTKNKVEKTKKEIKNKNVKVETKKVKDENKKVKVETKKLKDENKKVSKVVEEPKETVVVSTDDTLKKEKSKKIIKTIIYSLISIIIVGLFIYSIIESNDRTKHFKTISFNEVSEIMNDEVTNIIYWASPNCGYCVQFTPVVKEVSYEENVTFNYLNTANLSNDDYAAMVTYFGEYNETYNTKGLGTPSIILVKGGKVVDIQVGALDKEGLISYLTTKELIK